MNGLVDRTAEEDEKRVASVDCIKLIGFTSYEVEALNKIKRIMNLSDKGFEYLSNQLMQEEGKKVEDILRQWSRERRN